MLAKSSWLVLGSVCVAMVAHSGRVRAADSSSLGAIVVKPTMHAAGVMVPIVGDDNANATVAVSYKRAGGTQSLQGHRLLRLSGPRDAGSLLFLEPATDYELVLTLQDPDNPADVQATATFRTRDDTPPAAQGATLYVNGASGADSNDCSQAKPCKSIQHAVQNASAGITVRVAAGVYRESVTVEGSHGGVQGNPARLLAEPGAILDGSDSALEDAAAWKDEGGGVYSAPFSGECRYVAVDDERIYDYASLADLQNAAAGLPGGFFVDQAASRIYLKLPSGGALTGHAIHVAKLGVGVLIDTVTDVVVEGFEIRYFGSTQYSGVGVDVRDASRCWIRNNDIHHMNEGVRIRRETAADNVVEGNAIRDTSVWGWPWGAVKAHTPEASAISVTGAGGNIVRRNTTRGNFNGIYVGSFDDMSEQVAPDTDIYENTLLEHGDDGFEPEGACVNVRYWNNATHGVYNGISLAPIATGPLWVVRNLIDGYKEHALKVNNGPTGWMLVYHTTSVPALPDSQAFAPTEEFQHLVTRNNIWTGHRYVIESSVTPSGPVDLDYDNLFTDAIDGTPRFVKWLDVRYYTLDELKASNTIEQNGFSGEPAYENASQGDFRLVEGSPLLDVGQVIAGINDQGFAGAGPDVGAFERGGASPGSDGGLPDGWAGAAGSSGAAGAPGAGGSAGTETDGGAGATAAPSEVAADEGGCGCSMPGAAARPSWLLLLALGLLGRRAGAGRNRSACTRPRG